MGTEVVETPLADFIVANKRPAPTKVNYVVKGLIDSGRSSCLFGTSNTGKTALAVKLGADVCRGINFAGRKTRKSGVVHVAAEGPASVTLRTFPHVGEGAEGVDDAAPYLIYPGRIDLRDTELVNALAKKIRAEGERLGCDFGLVIIDTLVLSMGDGDENSTRDMSGAVDGANTLARLLQAHVMLIHHVGKADQTTARGSSALRAAVDSEFSLQTKEVDGSMITELVDSKQRDHRRGQRICFTIESAEVGIDQEGDAITTAVARIATTAVGVAGCDTKSSAREDIALDRTVEVELAMRRLMSSGPSRIADGVTAAAVRDECTGAAFAACPNPDSKRTAVSRILDARAKSSLSQIVRLNDQKLFTVEGV